MGPVLLISGIVATAFGTWRGYRHARDVIAPLAHPGEPTRTAVETTQPLVQRARVRRAVRSLGASLAWLAVAMYGLFLASTGMAVR
jgi:hypothetical protein